MVNGVGLLGVGWWESSSGIMPPVCTSVPYNNPRALGGGTFDSFRVILHTNRIFSLMSEYYLRQRFRFKICAPRFRIERLHYYHVSAIAAFGQKSRSGCVRLERRDDLSTSVKMYPVPRARKGYIPQLYRRRSQL